MKSILGFLKLNTDGCSKGNPRSSDGGGILRDNTGSCIFAFADFYDQISNHMAEIKAILQEMKMCIGNNYLNIVFESDSQLIVNFINKKTKVPWQVADIIDQINTISKYGNFSFVHTFNNNKKKTSVFPQNGVQGG